MRYFRLSLLPLCLFLFLSRFLALSSADAEDDSGDDDDDRDDEDPPDDDEEEEPDADDLRSAPCAGDSERARLAAVCVFAGCMISGPPTTLTGGGC